MKLKEMLEYVRGGGIDERLAALYGKESISAQRARYVAALEEFSGICSEDRETSIYSVPGRSELSGNHTDHNRGCVIAASVSLDIIAVASPRDDGKIYLVSEGFGTDLVDISEYGKPDSERFGSSAALVAGVCAGFSKRGYAVGGFDAYTTSSVLKGSGLSSSAAFEDMMGNILNHLYNGGEIDNTEIAEIAQYAENEFFGKPCGLMDQVACASGGIVAIDFADAAYPKIEKLDIDFDSTGYRLCIVNTGGNHADLTDDYASVPREMKAVAAFFGKEVLREVVEDEFAAALPVLRERFGDRAVLRSMHFFEENRRVCLQKEALINRDIEKFLEGVLASGRSSFCYLQNVYTNKNIEEQGLSLALCLAEKYLSGKSGAFRVHGGGFAGTVQIFVWRDDAERLRLLMDGVFGEGRAMILQIRPEGAVKIL